MNRNLQNILCLLLVLLDIIFLLKKTSCNSRFWRSLCCVFVNNILDNIVYTPFLIIFVNHVSHVCLSCVSYYNV